MRGVTFKTPEEDHEALEQYQEENNCSKSQAGRDILSRGVRYPEIEQKANRLEKTVKDIRQENTALKNRNEELETSMVQEIEKARREARDEAREQAKIQTEVIAEELLEEMRNKYHESYQVVEEGDGTTNIVLF